MCAIVLATHTRPSFPNTSHVKREPWACEPKQSGGVSVFPFASPCSPNKSRKRNADRRGYGCRILRCGSPLRTSRACTGGTEGGSPVGVPPRLLPKGVVVPEARLTGQGFLGPVRSDNPGLSQSSEHLARRS